MTDALLVNAGVLLVLVLILWAISVRIGDVSFIDAFWGAGMVVMALLAWAQLDAPSQLANLILVMTAACGACDLASTCFVAGAATARTSDMPASCRRIANAAHSPAPH